jgi:putative ABC transport system ATP-binding protein
MSADTGGGRARQPPNRKGSGVNGDTGGRTPGGCGTWRGDFWGGLPVMDALIRLSEATKRYAAGGAPALEHVSLAVAWGEAVAGMGPSGSGKTTLLNLVAGLHKPSTGTITVAGQPVDALSETGVARYRRTQAGMIFQFFNLLDDLTVAGNCFCPPSWPAPHGAEPGLRPPSCWTSLASPLPPQLPGTAVRRGAAAGGHSPNVNTPVVLLADEPTGALDTATGEEIGQLLLDLNRAGQTLVLVTHSPELAVKHAKRTMRLVGGQVASDSSIPQTTSTKRTNGVCHELEVWRTAGCGVVERGQEARLREAGAADRAGRGAGDACLRAGCRVLDRCRAGGGSPVYVCRQ